MKLRPIAQQSGLRDKACALQPIVCEEPTVMDEPVHVTFDIDQDGLKDIQHLQGLLNSPNLGDGTLQCRLDSEQTLRSSESGI